MTSRPLEATDYQMLKAALDHDNFDHDSPQDYASEGTESQVYEDGNGPIAVFRYSMALRISAVWCNNLDTLRNAKSAIKFFNDALAKAKDHGFTSIVFNTQSPTLAKFCIDQFGFEERKGEYVRNV